MEKLLWQLFKETGDIKYFNLLGKIERSKKYANSKNGRNYNNFSIISPIYIMIYLAKNYSSLLSIPNSFKYFSLSRQLSITFTNNSR